MEKFMSKQEIKYNIKWRTLITKLKTFFAQKMSLQPRLGMKQKNGKEFLQLVSMIKSSFLKYIESWFKLTRIQVIPQLINGQRI